LLNTVFHRSPEDSIKSRTLADFIERVGGKIQDYLLNLSNCVLDGHDFEHEHIFAQETESYDATVAAEQAAWNAEILLKVEEINNGRELHEQISDINRFPKLESPHSKCCYISIDDVGVKHQKEARKDGGIKNGKYVENTVIHIQFEENCHYLTARGMDAAFRMLYAFLLSNNLLNDCKLVFLADGARNIKNHIEKYFASYNHCLILDWYHLRKKCKELISSSFKGKIEQKKILAQNLLRILWVGNVDGAIAFLNGFDDSLVKSSYWLGELIGYLKRKDLQIVCYALRHAFSFRISSNKAEKANDLLVAQRQKHNGMSWSFKGSSALASVSMVMLNNNTAQWLKSESLPFAFPTQKAS